MLPGAFTLWRIPGWLVGVDTQKRREGFEGLRRRLEGENAVSDGTGAEAGETRRRRTLGRQLQDQFRGGF